jgi:superfamily II DNA or RNA helicase
MVEVIIGNTISRINGDIPNGVTQQLRGRLSYFNKGAQFTKPFRDKVWDGRTYLYKDKTQTLPTGLVNDALFVLSSNGINYQLTDNRIRPQTLIQPMWIFKGDIRDYQQEAIDNAVKVGRGVLEIATGGGKSIVYMGIIHRIGVRTLLIVNTKEALKDMEIAAYNCFGPDWFGIMGNGKKKQGALVTIITAKTAIRQPDIFFKGYEALIVDEYHRSASNEYMETITKMDVFYKIGGTGTNFRGDGKDLVLQALTGKVLYKIESKVLQEEGHLEKPKIVYIDTKQKEVPDLMFSDYRELYNAMITNNKERNKKIVEIVKRHIDRPKIILINSLEHGKILLEEIQKVDPNAKYVDGKSPKKYREQIKEDLTSGKQKTVCCSIIYNESINIERLEIAIIAAAGKSQIQLLQRLGRILRKHNDKENCILYDFIDSFSKKLEKQAKERMLTLKKAGYIIEIENNS